MEQTYQNRAIQQKNNQTARPAAHSVAARSNQALAGVFGMDSGSYDGGVGLEGWMQARMTQQFGSPVIQMKRPGEPAVGSVGSDEELISNLEQRSGVDLGDVQIHRDSSKPAEIGALAYAQGSQVYLGPGQDRHLSHELTHVVQQKQGMVQPTGTVEGMPVNTSPALEHAADAMQVSAAPEATSGPGVIQGVFIDSNGKRLGKKDMDSMKQQFSDSLNSMIDQKTERLTEKLTKEKEKLQLRAKHLQKDLGRRLDKGYRSKSEISADEEMKQMIGEAACRMHVDLKKIGQ